MNRRHLLGLLAATPFAITRPAGVLLLEDIRRENNG